MIHPSLQDWKQAKKSALLLAANMGAEIVQSPDGKNKRVILRHGKAVDCVSWYAAYCVLHRIRLDQITRGGKDPPPVPTANPPPMAKFV